MYGLAFGLFLNSAIQLIFGNMPSGRVDIAWLLSNASDMRIKALGSPCALAKWLTLCIKFVCCY